MRLLRFVCLLAIQLSAATLFLMSQSGPSSQINQAAQTNPAPIVHPSNGHAAVQIHHPGLPHDLVAKWKRRALASHGAHSASKSRSRLSKSQTTELSFAPIVNYGSGGADVDSVAVADVNGDGIPDLVVANGNFNAGADGSVAVLLGNGDGTFQAAVSYDSGGAGAEAVAIADVSGDGKPDLLVANECASSANCANGTISVLLGNGDGTFQPAISYGSGGYDAASVAVSDVNGDGIPDLVVGNSCGTSVASGGCPSVFVNGIGDEWNYEGVIGVLLGNGDGTFQTVATFDSGGTLASSVAVVDANSGNRAIVVVNYCPSQEVGPFESCWVGYYSTLGVLLGNGDGTFQPPVDYNSGGYYSDGVAVADFNRDGKPDLVLSSGEAQWGAQVGSVGVLLGNGDGTFQATQSYDSGAPWTESVAVADVIGDGNLDVVVANLCASQASCTSGSIGALLGNGNGTFQPALSYGSGGGGEFYSLAVADLNGDGKPDVAVTNECDVPSSGDCNGFVGIFINTSTSNTATALVSSVSPSNFGQSVTFTATVTSSQFFEFQPTGTVTFTYGGTVLCNAVTLSGGMASCAYSSLPVGTDRVTAAYTGDVNFGGSSASLNQVVNLPSTTLALTSSVNPSVQGRPVTLTAAVSSQWGAATPAGTVTFQNGSTVLATKTLSRGTAKYTTSALPAGSNTITAVYGGSTTYSGSTATPLIQAVTATTITVVASSPNPSTDGQTVLFVAAVASSIGAPPDGETITFERGSLVLGTGTLSGGIATFLDSTLGVGTDSVKAVYGGDTNFEGSTATVSHVIDKAATTTTLVSSENPSNSGQRVTFTAKVSGQFGGIVTGSVTFSDGSTMLKKVPLNNGSAEYATSALASGNHNITATYDGSRDFTDSSASLTQTIN